MSVLDTILTYFAPYDCVGCGAESSLLCLSCQNDLPRSLIRGCYRCGATSDTCHPSLLGQVQAATVYGSVAKDVVWKLKSDGARSAAGIMAAVIDRRCTFKPDSIIVPIPTATSRVRARGYDHAYAVSRELGRKVGLSTLACLRRSSQAHQVGASRLQRLSQLEGSFWVRNTSLIAGKSIVLVDDVLTTGASLEVAAQALLEAGAAGVEGVVFARTLGK